MKTISLNFEANDLPVYGFEPAEETEYGIRFRNGNTDIYYEAESDTFLISKEGHILFNGRITSHGFCKQLLRSIEAIKTHSGKTDGRESCNDSE
jgi:hypothetical protein